MEQSRDSNTPSNKTIPNNSNKRKNNINNNNNQSAGSIFTSSNSNRIKNSVQTVHPEKQQVKIAIIIRNKQKILHHQIIINFLCVEIQIRVVRKK